MKTPILFCQLVLTAAVVVLATQPATAQITVATVPVGLAGNPNDTTGYGGVAYGYYMGQHEVTLNQYNTFLNAIGATDTYGLWNSQMSISANIAGIARSGSPGSYSYSVIGDGNRPVTYVGWFDAARFVNWLQNGQPTGAQTAATTEQGAYTLNGALSGVILRNLGATYGLPSENEWYKSAYYQPAVSGGDADGYWQYAPGFNTIPNSRNGSASDPNSANFIRNVAPAGDGVNDGYAVTGTPAFPVGNALTVAGAYSVADSFFGTFDQNGNVWEWNDAVNGANRGLRGGSWLDTEGNLRATSRFTVAPGSEANNIGFRIVVVPEPGTVSLLLAGLALLAARRRRG